MINAKAKSLGDVLEAVKNGEKPSYDELLYSLLALQALHSFDFWDLQDLSEKPAAIAKLKAAESYRRFQGALAVPPKQYVGWNNDPQNPEYQKFRQLGKNIIDRALKGPSIQERNP